MALNKVIEAKVVKVNSTFLEIETHDGLRGIVHISEVSDYFVSNISNIFKTGKKYWFKIIEEDTENKLKFSWKELKPRFLKDPFEFEIQETKSGFKNLKEKTELEIEND